MKSYLKYWPFAIVLLLLLTNPSISAFKEHLGRSSYEGLIRERNYLIFSEYIDAETNREYKGILANFIAEEERKQAVIDSAAKINSEIKPPLPKGFTATK